MPITFHTANIKFALKQKVELRAFLFQSLQPLKPTHIHLTYIFCTDEYLLGINRQFLNHDYYTDIITFSLSKQEGSLEGEIYISIDRVKENSLRFAASELDEKSLFLIELQRVMFHGVLHLLGYKDKTKSQKAEMRKMEEQWLRRFKKFTLQ